MQQIETIRREINQIMSFQKSPTMVGNVQIIMSSLKQFERKLDKLQDDVDFHGKTLKELRSLVSGLSSGTITNPDVKADDNNNSKRSFTSKAPKINTGQQYDEVPSNKDLSTKVKRKHALQPFPSKIQEKWLGKHPVASQKNRCHPCHVTHKASSPTSIPVKNSLKSFKSSRPSKAEAPRKATTLRTQKGADKKRSIISS